MKTGALEELIKGMLNSSFIPSAKHPFQLLRKQKVGGQDFIFNVDLLHPEMIKEKDDAGMFVDHLDFDIPLSEEYLEKIKMKSIVLPNSKVLFEENIYDIQPIGGLKFNLVDFEGMFITKMDSCQKVKRQRDSYDIYIAFENNGIDTQRIRDLASKYVKIEKSVTDFCMYLKGNTDEFNENVKMFSSKVQGSPANEILKKL